MPRVLLKLLLVIVAAALTPLAAASPAHARTCADHATQADPQRAGDTRDGDGDGVFCESLPCPCLRPGQGGGSGGDRPASSRPTGGCTRPRGVVRISFSARQYPNIRRHTPRAIRAGWPAVMVLNRRGADARRDRLLERFETRDGIDRDEYPAAVGRGRGPGLERGTDPRGWRASVAYVPSSENRSHGASLGSRLRRFCGGTRFRYRFR